MNTRLIALAFALATCVMITTRPQIAWSAPTNASHRVGAIAKPRTVGEVICEPLFVCDIALDPGESILFMATGDSARWILSTMLSGPDAATPHVLVKPTDYELRTDLIIATDKRVCYLTMTSARNGARKRMRLYYPVVEVAHIIRGDASSDGPHVSLQRLDLAYRVRGDSGFKPTRVSNDGAHTYIQMPPSIQDMPVVFAIATDGSDALVNYRFRYGMFIVDGVPQRLALVQGSGRGQRRVIIERGD